MVNNNNMATILNSALQMAVGSTDIDTLASYDFVDGGKAFTDFNVTKEQFTQALMNVKIRDFLTDGRYDESYKDPFFKDSARFGAILQLIHIGLPEVKNSRAWTDFSGGNVTVGTYTVTPPSVYTTIIDEGSSSFCCECWVTGEQWDTAFRSEEDRDYFINGVFLALENSLTAHLEVLAETARNTFIARKFNFVAGGGTGVHVVNPIQLYIDEVLGGSANMTEDITPEMFLNDKDMLIFGASKILEYIGYMYKMSTLFNTEGYERFVPRERLVVQILDYFEKRFNSIARSSTFHDELIALPAYQNVASWQALTDTNGDLTFDALSSINIQLDNESPATVINQSGIIGFIADSWCIGTTIVNRRSYSKFFPPENITLYGSDCRQRIWNNLSMNAVVFYLETVENPN